MFYTDQQRLIYTNPLGAFDPLALQRKLVIASGGQINSYLGTWGDPDAPEVAVAVAEDKVVAVARAAFGADPVTAEGGRSDAEVLDALCDFLRWLEGKDLRGSGPP